MNAIFIFLTHWGRVTRPSLVPIMSCHLALLSPDMCQAIIWTNAGILLIGPLGTNFSEILIGIHRFSLKKYIWKCLLENGSLSSRPGCVNLFELGQGVVYHQCQSLCSLSLYHWKFLLSSLTLFLHSWRYFTTLGDLPYNCLWSRCLHDDVVCHVCRVFILLTVLGQKCLSGPRPSSLLEAILALLGQLLQPLQNITQEPPRHAGRQGPILPPLSQADYPMAVQLSFESCTAIG